MNHAMRWAWVRRGMVALAVGVAGADCGPAPDGDVEVKVDETPPPDAELVAARPYRLIVPTSYSKDVAVPIVMLLHGYGGSAQEIDQYYGFSAYAEYAGFLGVVPTGQMDSTGARNWNVSPVHSAPFDAAYLRGVISDVQAKYNVDAKRIFVIGFSAGANMAHRMGCEVSSKIAAFASVAGQVAKAPASCAPTEAVSAVEIHGDADEVIGYNGDVRDPPSPAIPTAHETIGVWARNDVCTGALTATGVRRDLITDVDGAETRIDAYEGCPAGIGVELWTSEGGPHHPDVQRDWLSYVYGFLKAHPKP